MYQDFINIIKKNFNKNQSKVIFSAFDFALEAHHNQLRNTGEPYIIHPIAVCEILIEYGMDHTTIAAALLHDILEDTDITEEELSQKFGKEIATLVNGVSRVKTLKYKSYDEENADNLRKMFFAMSKDIRVVLIKLADRLHNMRTLEFVPREKQMRKAKDTFDVYVPIAERLGMIRMKTEMEDLCFRFLQPNEYNMVERDLTLRFGKYNETLNEINQSLNNLLKKLNIKGEIFSRFKHKYSIYKKLLNKGIEKIYDILAHRIIVHNVKDCYAILGEVHNNWKPIPGRIKDYIAAPKPNMYQSLHTTLVTENGIPFEIQIRTYEMHKLCEYGIAAHWKYKSGNTSINFSDFDKKLAFLSEAIESNKEISDSKAFVDTTIGDFYTSTIFVFTPKFKVLQLPEKSTPIDFAYSIHSELGNKCAGAKVNGKIVPLNTQLNTGDIVEVIVSGSAKGPSRDWLKFAQTSTARNRIRNYFKREMRDENIKLGRDMLELEAKRTGYSLPVFMSDSKVVNFVLEKYNCSTIEDLYAIVGYGGYTAHQVASKFIKELKLTIKQEKKLEIKKQTEQKKTGVTVDGSGDDLYIRLGKCCNPIPGDDIIGFTSRGKGIIVHRKSCSNLKNIEKERLIDVSWTNMKNIKYTVKLQIQAKNTTGLLTQISTIISNMNIDITGIKASVNNGESIINMTLQIPDKKHISELTNKLGQIPEVYQVFRN